MKPKTSRWLKNLNPEQRQAVETVEGPLLVLAGAGSGKTRVITHRVAHMMEAHAVEPGQILAMTFTNKAAAEMRQRLAAMVGAKQATGVTLSTFHSLGLRILRHEWGRGRKRSKRFTIYDTGDQLAALREVGRRIRLERSLDLDSILQRISAFKNAFIGPDAVPTPGDDPYDVAAAELYPGYMEQLEAFAAVDFDDLVCLPCALMEGSKACRKRWSDRFRYVLVDEYQDTNHAQLRMLHAIAGPHRNLCVVGDDDQSIYGWRGAEVKNILRFEKDFSGAKTVYLQRNYRSVAPVLKLANKVIAENKQRHKKKLIPVREGGAAVRVIVCSDGDSEASWVARFIADEVRKGRRRARDVAVLYRSNLLSRDLETELRVEGIPYRVLGGQAFYESKEVKDLLAYLRVCCNPGDEISLRRIINFPPRGIGIQTINTLGGWAEKNEVSFYKTLQQADEILDGSRSAGAVAGFLELIKRHRGRLNGKTLQAAGVRELVEDLRLRDTINGSKAPIKAVERRLAQLGAVVEGVASYCDRVEKPTLLDYVNRTALTSSDDEIDGDAGDVVTLSTLHGSKGLEFPLVVLIGCEEGYLPHERTLNPRQNDLNVGDIAEERRLCYVGITRAMDELVLTRCNVRMQRGRPVPRTPSRFLDGVPESLLTVEDLCREPDAGEVQSMLADLLAKLES
jgi:ATP-dependent DNA helicase UvrD/PcrA